MTDLPPILPIFPLTGALLLPETRMPLHIFEPRYRAMIEDAMESGQPLVGMIQPFVPADDNRGPAVNEDPDAPPELYAIGCVGEIESAQKLDDGRWVLLLKGVQRFRVERELPLHNGYRRAEVDWAPFEHDQGEKLPDDETERLLEGLQSFGEARKMEFDFDALSQLPGAAILHGVAAALPFGPAERQALLESETVLSRLELLLGLLSMESDPRFGRQQVAPN